MSLDIPYQTQLRSGIARKDTLTLDDIPSSCETPVLVPSSGISDNHISGGGALFEDIPIYKMSAVMFFDGIGFYGPIIVIIIICMALYRQQKYMWIYIICIFVNNYINRVLKLMILERRPDNPIPFSKYENYKHAEMYGMPSGHASAIGFSILYLLLVKGYSGWAIACMFIGVLTMYQRWKYRRHTAEQVIIGVITGSIFGWIVYTLATRWIIWL